MTTHNGAATIGDSIASVLAQDMDDFELVIVDDASTDATPELLRRQTDPRIVPVRNQIRQGIAGARNVGIAVCRAPYIAALDHDDLSAPSRLRRQADYLDAHPDTVLVGTAVRELKEGRLRRENKPPHTSPGHLRLLLHLDNPLGWSSVMLRSDPLRRLEPPMRPEFDGADDLDLFHRLMPFGRIDRLDDVLTTYRWHKSNATHGIGERMSRATVEIYLRVCAPWLGPDPQADALLLARHGCNREPIGDAETLDRVHSLFRTIAEGLARQHPHERAEILHGLDGILWRVTRAAIRSGNPRLMRAPFPPLDGPLSLAIALARAALRRLGIGTKGA